jgi:hypothetical protein
MAGLSDFGVVGGVWWVRSGAWMYLLCDLEVVVSYVAKVVYVLPVSLSLS